MGPGGRGRLESLGGRGQKRRREIFVQFLYEIRNLEYILRNTKTRGRHLRHRLNQAPLAARRQAFAAAGSIRKGRQGNGSGRGRTKRYAQPKVTRLAKAAFLPSRGSEGEALGRPRCDVFDAVGIPEAIARGETTARRAYEDYADGAARPYAHSTFDLLLHRAGDAMAGPPSEPTTTDDVKADATSADYWGERLKVKPSVVTTFADNASLRVNGGALVVFDGKGSLKYAGGGKHPSAIVIAYRWWRSIGCAIFHHHVASTEGKRIDPARSSSGRPGMGRQTFVQTKIAEAVRAGAISKRRGAQVRSKRRLRKVGTRSLTAAG